MKSRIRIILVLIIIFGVLLQNTIIAMAEKGGGNFQRSNNDELKNPLSQKQVMHCANLTREEVLATYGRAYEIVPTGSEGEQKGYYYKGIGVTFVFLSDKSNEKVLRIECDNSISINGAKAGMTFEQIQEKLGEASIVQDTIEVYYDIYILGYLIDNCRVVFSSFKADGKNSRLMIIEKRSY